MEKITTQVLNNLIPSHPTNSSMNMIECDLHEHMYFLSKEIDCNNH